ncbi:MAG: hypothetical protein HY046_01245, partial [Acidobacteria bacterium]|nr:hypothetical protein [Acidobacteriota bacterium]
ERAIERGLHETLQGELVGREIVQLAREEKPSAILKAWEEEELLGAAHPQLARRHPDYEGITRTMRVRDSLIAAGYPSGRVYRALVVPLTYQILGRLKQRERTAAMTRMEFRVKLADAIQSIENDAAKSVKTLMGKKTAANRDAFDFLESLPLEQLIFIQTEFSKPRALGKIKNYLQKWRPLRRDLPIEELEKLGIPRGPKFDKILEQLFNVQLGGRGRAPDDRTRLLRSFAGLKPEPKKKKEKEEIPLLKGKKDAGKDAGKEAAPEKGKLTKTPIPPPPQSKIVKAMSRPERPKRPAAKSHKPAKKKKKR